MKSDWQLFIAEKVSVPPSREYNLHCYTPRSISLSSLTTSINIHVPIMSISSLPFAIYARGGGRTPYDGLYGEAPPERGIFFRPQVYKSVGVSLVEVDKCQGNLSFGSVKRPTRANRWTLWLYKVEKTFDFSDLFLFKRQFIWSS